jgi:hypothetical protein
MDRTNRWHPVMLPDDYIRKVKQNLSELEAQVESKTRYEPDPRRRTRSLTGCHSGSDTRRDTRSDLRSLSREDSRRSTCSHPRCHTRCLTRGLFCSLTCSDSRPDNACGPNPDIAPEDWQVSGHRFGTTARCQARHLAVACGLMRVVV